MATDTSVGSIQDNLSKRVEGVIDAFRASGSAGEDERRLPPSVYEAMQKEELFSLMAPREYGGAQVELQTFMETIEELAQEDGALGWTYAILAAGSLMTSYLPAGGAQDIFSKGANVALGGSVVPAGRAVPVDGGYLLSGRWPLASGGHYGEWIGFTGLVLDGDMPRMGPNGTPDIHSMFVRREDCRLIDTWHSMGMRGTGSIDFVVENAFVPLNHAFSLFFTPPTVEGPMYRAGPLVLFSLSISSVFPGIARRAIDEFVELAKRKTRTLSQTGLASRPTIHAEVARAEAQVQSSRAYLYTVTAEITHALETTGYVPDDLEARRRLACANVAASCRSAVDTMFNLAGSTPVYSGNPLERCLRDIHAASQHLIVSPVWWEKTGQYYFDLGLGMP